MFLFSKKKNSGDDGAACMTCQHSRLQDGEYYCKIKKKNFDKFHSCKKYLYDITKRVPRGFDSNKISHISIDPSDL